MIYRAAKISDNTSLAKIHMEAFKNFFLTSLGYNFLCNYYYSCLAEESSILICAVDENENVVGFATGTMNSSGYHRALLLNNKFRFIISAIKIFISNPIAIKRLYNNFSKTNHSFDDGNYAELLSIAVIPGLKGAGLGSNLLSQFESEVKKRGGERLSLTTDYEDNNDVLEFYAKCEYKVFYDFLTYPERRMYRLIKSIT